MVQMALFQDLKITSWEPEISYLQLEIYKTSSKLMTVLVDKRRVRMICRVTGSALIFLANWLLGASTVYSNELEIEGGYRVSIPEGVEVEVQTPVEDFILYNFRVQNETSFLTLYIGNQPNGYSENPQGNEGTCIIEPLTDFSSICPEMLDNQDTS